MATFQTNDVSDDTLEYQDAKKSQIFAANSLDGEIQICLPCYLQPADRETAFVSLLHQMGRAKNKMVAGDLPRGPIGPEHQVPMWVVISITIE